MTQLVEELKDEHKILTETLMKIKEKGTISGESKKELFDAKDFLLAHLKKEDEKLYPVLNMAAENDENLKRTLNIFATDMDNISKAAISFFSKYENDSHGLEFAKNLGNLLSILASRIQKEESILYKKFDEIIS